MGSSRTNGDTSSMVDIIVQYSGWNRVDLVDYDFRYYDYNHRNKEDDFLDLMRGIIHENDTLIFATPVYWYAMSGIMKVFFDRMTDLLQIEKDLGRQLRGKSMAALSSSTGSNLGDHFWLPFSETANYLGMNYLGHLHTIAGDVDLAELRAFVDEVEAKIAAMG